MTDRESAAVAAEPTDPLALAGAASGAPAHEAEDGVATEFDPFAHYMESKLAKRKLRGLGRLVRNALKVAHGASPRLLYVSVFLQLLNAALLAIQVYAGKEAIEEILRANAHHGSFSEALPGLIALLAATGIANFLGAAQVNVQRLLGERVVYATWDMVLGVTTSVDLATFESPTFFDELQRVEANALARPVTLLQGLVALLGGLISTVGICFALLAIAPILLPILLVSGLPLALLSRRGSGLEFRFQLGQSTAGRMRYYLIELQAEREHAKELRAFGTARHLRRLWRESYEIYFAALVKHVRRLTAIAAAGSLVSTLVLAFAVGVVVELVLHGHLSLAAAGAGILAARTLSSMIASIFTGIQEILECTLFLEDLETFAERGSPQPEQEAAPAQRAPGPAAKPLDSIELDRVGFRYPESRQISLEGVSLRIEAGQIVALVGENGSGKTTLAKLISGLLRPTDGSLRWNGRDIGTYDSGEISRNVTVIFQDFAKYAFSAENNITIGDVDRPVEPGYTQEIAQRAGVHQILSGLQDGYDTMLGRVFGGVDLSIGQWQRVAIARAFYRDADFLILDEPTSALDPRAEAELFTRMRELAGGRTVLLISHRFSTVRSADKIIVLEKGRIHESGTHDELMRLGGRYAELFELQARAYR